MSGTTVQYRQIADVYAEKIRSGELAPGARMPSDRKVAYIHHSSVSTATAAMEELVRRHLAVRRQGAGTFVAQDALQPCKQLRIGFFAPNGCRYVQRMGTALLDWCFRENCSTAAFFGPLEEFEELLASCRMDGFLLYNCSRQALNMVRKHRRRQLPTLLVSSKIDSEPELSFGYSNEKIINSAIEHLVGLEHRNIGMILNRENPIPVQERTQAFLKAMWHRQLPVNPAWMLDDPTPEKLRKYFSAPELPSAVIICLCSLTKSVCQAVREVGLKIPEELSLLCIDEPEPPGEFPVSYMEINVADFIEQAAERLRGMILREPVPPPRDCEFKLIDGNQSLKKREGNR